MNREIKFRGKRLDNDEWVYGCLIYDNVQTRIVSDLTQYNSGYCDTKSVEVDPETVGQYTGLKDKGGKEIYEGDIIVGESKIKYLVEFTFGRFIGRSKSKLTYCDPRFFHKLGIIGNIHDNPELIHDQKAEV